MRYFVDNEFALFIQASLAKIRETKVPVSRKRDFNL